MILTAHQPTYLPWLGLFHKIALSDKFIYLDNIQYEKNSWQNRNKIKTSDGTLWLTIPVHAHINLNCNEIKIDNTHNWNQKHSKTIEINYTKAPYYESYKHFFKKIFSKKWEYLSELNEYILKWFLDEFKINTEFLKTSDFELEGKKSDLILEICEKFNAKKYVSGILGKNYIDPEIFRRKDITLIFQDYIHPNYKQLYGNFISNMSIIDLLFNCGPDSFKILMSNNISKSQL